MININNQKKKSYLEVHIAVLLFGMTGLFAKLIHLSPFIIVLGRVFFSSIFIFFWTRIRHESFRLQQKEDYKKIGIMGILLAIHWTAFFGAIQLSNVAVGLLTFSTFPIFVSLFAPFVSKRPINRIEVFCGFITLIGILFIIPLNDIFSQTMLGGLTGVFSGAVYALFTGYNEKLVTRYHGRIVAFYEQVTATIVLIPCLFIFKTPATSQDILLMILLGVVFTGIGHTLFINGLKNVSAYMAAIITMLEPLYSIVLAFIILGEPISFKTAIGGIIILSTVIALSLSKNSQN